MKKWPLGDEKVEENQSLAVESVLQRLQDRLAVEKEEQQSLPLREGRNTERNVFRLWPQQAVGVKLEEGKSANNG